MTSECVGDFEGATSGSQTKPSPDLIPNQPKSKSGEQSRQQSTSQNSPSKRAESSSPTKSRNRRKNDARRRSGSHKKQAANNEQSERQSQIPKLSNTDQSSELQHTNSKDSNSTTSDNLETNPENSREQSQQPQKQHSCNDDKNGNESQGTKQSDIHKEHEKVYKELGGQIESQNLQIQSLVLQAKQQINKVKELEAVLLNTTRTCTQLEKLLQQELSSRTKLEAENESLNQTVARLKKQLCVFEKNKFNNDELMRVLNATLMERETEVSILKLKLTRIQTNPSSTVGLNSASSVSSVKQEPSQIYAASGRSNSEFNRNSYIRSSMLAEAAANVRSSTSQLRSTERDASVWATVPEELTPSKRPMMLDRSFQGGYGESCYNPYGNVRSQAENDSSSPLVRDRRYKTLPRSMKSPSQEFSANLNPTNAQQSNDKTCLDDNKPNIKHATHCQVTNLDDSSSTNQSNKTSNSINNEDQKQVSSRENDISLPRNSNENDNKVTENRIYDDPTNRKSTNDIDSSHYSTISKTNVNSKSAIRQSSIVEENDGPPSLPQRTPSTPVKSSKMKRLLDKFRRTDSSTNSASKTDLNSSPVTPVASPFRRGANRSTMVGAPSDIRAQISPMRQAANFQTDKPFDEWDTDMLVDWLTMIGLSMYTIQCRRWVKCGAHIMNATPAEVDKGLGITNHLHRKKLRLAISELNGDCDKITKAAAKLDYLWVARWLDDIGLPQHKEAFINARVDGRVLNYLTVEDLISMGVKSVLHHASIRCGIKVLRSIQFDLQLLKRRATAEEIEQMKPINPQMVAQDNRFKNAYDTSSMGDPSVSLWTCHRLMEWLRLIDFAEYAPNLRGSGVHGGLMVFEDGFNFDTLCSLLSIPIGSTLLRRHLSTYFKDLIGKELVQRKRQYQDLATNQQLNPLAEIKTPKKSQLWFTKLKSSKVAQDGMDEYLCPMYPVEPQLIKSLNRKVEDLKDRDTSKLSEIPESINV